MQIYWTTVTSIVEASAPIKQLNQHKMKDYSLENQSNNNNEDEKGITQNSVCVAVT